MRSEEQIRERLSEIVLEQRRKISGLDLAAVSIAYERLKALEKLKIEEAALLWVLGERELLR